MELVEKLRHYASDMKPSGLGGAGHALAPSRAPMLEQAADEIDRLRAALRAFAVHATYPVATEINPRGYAWRGEEALDYAKGLADAALEQKGPEA